MCHSQRATAFALGRDYTALRKCVQAVLSGPRFSERELAHLPTRRIVATAIGPKAHGEVGANLNTSARSQVTCKARAMPFRLPFASTYHAVLAVKGCALCDRLRPKAV